MNPIVVDRYKTANETLRVPDLRQALYDEGAIMFEKTIVNLHGEEHRVRRNVEIKVFRRDFFKWYEKAVFPATLEETIAPYLKQGSADLVNLGFRVMMNLTADFSGVDRPTRTPEETDRLLRNLLTFGKAATLGQALGDKEVIRDEIRKAMAEFDKEFFQPSMRRRRELLARFAKGELKEEELPRDILVELLRNEAEVPLSQDVLMKEIGFFLLAGAFTSIHTLSHAMHELFWWGEQHPPDKQRQRTDMLFLQRSIHESMRLHPSSPTAGRRPTCPMQLPGGANATPSDYVSIDLMKANRDAEVFGADAADYNPHREVQKGTPPYGLSFGIGMHSCLGLNLAAGALAKPSTDSAEHQFGTVTLIARSLLAHNARPDPDSPGAIDRSTVRNNWGKYPILLG